jgi:hypothetical protein
MREVLLSILAACERSSNGRRLFFSSFDPDAALLMRKLQSRWCAPGDTRRGQEAVVMCTS